MTTVPARSATTHRSTPADPQDLPSVARTGAWALAACLGATLLLLLLAASVAGAEPEVVRLDGRSVVVTASSVAVTVLLSVLAGIVLLGLVGRRSRRAWIGVAVGGLVVALLSTVSPLLSQAGPVATVALVAMHVACGLVWLTALTVPLARR